MRYAFVAAVLLLACTPAIAQGAPGINEIEFKEPVPGPAHGGNVSDDRFVAGVYLLIPKQDGRLEDGTMTSSIVTFNADGCTDSSSMWDGPLGAMSGNNGAAHGTWQVTPRTRELHARLYYFTQTPAGLLDRLGLAHLTANLNRDLSEGVGEVVFGSYLPAQLPDALMAGYEEEPLGGRFKIPVRLVKLR